MRRLMILMLGALGTTSAHAKIVEETVTLPAEVQDVRGRLVSHPLQVTIYRDDARRQKQPFMILNHGRSAKQADRAETAV